MEHNGWDHALKVTGGGTGLVGHAGAVLLRKAADQAGLTAGLGAALRKAGTSPVFDRGIVLVSLAAFRSSTAPAWPTRPVPSAVTFRAWSHPLCSMAKSAPVRETCVW